MHLQMSQEEHSTVNSIPATSTLIWELLHAFKLSRHARWRGRGYMVTSLEPNLVASSAAPHRMAPVANVAAL
jgi:hypothetical protein